MAIHHICRNLVAACAVIFFTACGGGGGGNTTGSPTPSPTPNFIELVDPTPGEGDNFGTVVEVLDNGNIVVTDPFDSSIEENNGAVHFYSSAGALIRSVYGNSVNDQLGSGGVVVLSNGNYVIVSELDDENNIVDGGSVRLFNGEDGTPIQTVLGNADTINFGSDGFGRITVKALTNGNFVIGAARDSSVVAGGGSVRLINGDTGAQIGQAIEGDQVEDFLSRGVGDASGIVALANGNYVIASNFDDVGGIVNSGSVRLINGDTGQAIGDVIAGDTENDFYSENVIPLATGDFIVAATNDDEDTLTNSGTVFLVDGENGAIISNILNGDNSQDFIGRAVSVLPNGNFVVGSSLDDVNGIPDVGTVALFDGLNFMQIGMTLVGDDSMDSLSSGGGIVPLPNNNYVVITTSDDVNGILDAGSIMLFDGTTGEQIGPTHSGDNNDDQLGRNWFGTFGSGQTVQLANGNFVVGSRLDDNDGMTDVGSVRLYSGSSGEQIGSTIFGNVEGSRLGGQLFAFGNNFLLVGRTEDIGDGTQAGTSRLFNGVTGDQIGETENAETVGDFNNVSFDVLPSAMGYVLGLPNYVNNGSAESGQVRLYNTPQIF